MSWCGGGELSQFYNARLVLSKGLIAVLLLTKVVYSKPINSSTVLAENVPKAISKLWFLPHLKCLLHVLIHSMASQISYVGVISHIITLFFNLYQIFIAF